MLALQLAAQIAGGPDLLEVGELPTGPVIYLPAEDPPTAIHHRLHALGAHLSAEERQAVADGLLIQPLIGSLPNIMAPEWFDGLKRGERKRSKLDVTYDYGDGKRIEFSGPEPLGADDLRILQGLVAMAGPNGLVLGPEPKTEGGRQLRLFLEPKWEAVTADAMVVKGSYRALAKEIGAEVDSGGALKHIQDCIERLWKVSIIAQNGRKRQGFRLLSEYASDEADGRLYVALNPLIAQAVMGGGQHVRISMDEVRALDSETARLLHQRLCGWIDPGKTGKASIDTLCGYVWPSEASGSTMRKRRQRVREALPELVALGWTVTEFAAGKYDITRPKAAG